MFTTLFILVLGDTSRAETVVGESIIQDEQIWSLSGSPYRIQGNINIPEEASLLVEGGCVLIFEGKYGIDVAGRFSLSGWVQTIRLEGQDLGNGKHILWRGINPTSAHASISLVHASIQDAEVAVNFSGFMYQAISPELYCNEVSFENNLTALQTGEQGSDFVLTACKFLNNAIGIQGNYSSIDSISNAHPLNIATSLFAGNETAIQSAWCAIEACQFENNIRAIDDGMYLSIDSSGFKSNDLAISGYGLKIERCIFFLNDKAVIHTGRKPLRDKLLRNSLIRSNNFESNKEALFLEDGAMIEEMSCNLFTKNDIALVLPDSLYNSQKAPFRVEKNIFIQNILAIQVLELEAAAAPAPGSSPEPVNFLYNMLALNFIILDHTSPYNLNFFHNYMLEVDSFFIDLRMVDGDDKPGVVGLVNYTVSGDTSLVNELITVNIIKEVIKHNNYDSAMIGGNTYAFKMCASMPGNVLGIPSGDEKIRVSVYPNPFTHMLRVEWEEELQFDFHLYNLTGQEVTLKNAEGLSSPATFDLGHLEAGIYLLRAISGNEVHTLKLIKN